jgi:predicted RNA binding protein YcfA (HicA-like mRNA interferase family)
MSRLPGVTGKEVIAALNRMGFQEIRIRGSHHYLRHPDGRATVVSAHAGETIGRGLLSKILRDAKISSDDPKAKL